MQDTGSVAPIFRLDAGLRHNFKQGVPVHFEIWAVWQTEGSDTADLRSILSLQFILLLGWGHRFFLQTNSGLSEGFP